MPYILVDHQNSNKVARTTVMLTARNFVRLMRECKRRYVTEGATTAPSRILNEMLDAHLEPVQEENDPAALEKAFRELRPSRAGRGGKRKSKKKPVTIARSVA
jgi:hypothetical protein